MDVTNGDSYFDAELWLKDVYRYAGRKTRRVMLVATKCDAKSARVVDNDALKEARVFSRLLSLSSDQITFKNIPIFVSLLLTLCLPHSACSGFTTCSLVASFTDALFQWAEQHHISFYTVSELTG